VHLLKKGEVPADYLRHEVFLLALDVDRMQTVFDRVNELFLDVLACLPITFFICFAQLFLVV
jgi:hypothetical protein